MFASCSEPRRRLDARPQSRYARAEWKVSEVSTMRAITRMHLAAVLVMVLGVAGFTPGPATGSDNFDAATIRAQQAQLRSDAEARRGPFKDIGESERAELSRQQDIVDRLTRDVSRTTELREAQQVELLNALEHISAIVNRAEDERLVCRRHRPTGSNRPTTTCRTVAQLRADRVSVEQEVGRPRACTDSAFRDGSCF